MLNIHIHAYMHTVADLSLASIFAKSALICSFVRSVGRGPAEFRNEKLYLRRVLAIWDTDTPGRGEHDIRIADNR